MSWQIFDFGSSGTTVIDGANIYTGSILGASIKANEITGNLIKAGAIDTTRLSFTPVTGAPSGSLVSQVVAAINADGEGGLKINASKLVLTGLLQVGGAAGDINTHSTTIDGGKITAYSVTTNQLQAGSVSTDKLTVGVVARQNLITNGHFGTYNTYGDKQSGWTLDGGIFRPSLGTYIAGGTTTSLNVPCVTATISGSMQLLSQRVSVTPGRYYTLVGLLYHSSGTAGIRVMAVGGAELSSTWAPGISAGSVVPTFYQNATMVAGGQAASASSGRWNLYAYRVLIPNGITQVDIQICGWITGAMDVYPAFIQFYDDNLAEDSVAAGGGLFVNVGTVSTGASGSPASITNTGTPANAVLNFTLPRGDQGIQGIQGIQGNPGNAATFTLGSVTTGAPGSSVVMTNSGTNTAAVLNFTIPRGNPGATTGATWGSITSGTAQSAPNAGWTGNHGAMTMGTLTAANATIADDFTINNATLAITTFFGTTYRHRSAGAYAWDRFNADSGELRREAGYAGYGGYQTFWTNGVQRLLIDTTGLITSSGTMAVVASDARLYVRGGGATNGFLIEQDASKDCYVHNYEARPIYFGTANTTRFSILADGSASFQGNPVSMGTLTATGIAPCIPGWAAANAGLIKANWSDSINVGMTLQVRQGGTLMDALTIDSLKAATFASSVAMGALTATSVATGITAGTSFQSTNTGSNYGSLAANRLLIQHEGGGTARIYSCGADASSYGDMRFYSCNSTTTALNMMIINNIGVTLAGTTKTNNLEAAGGIAATGSGSSFNGLSSILTTSGWSWIRLAAAGVPDVHIGLNSVASDGLQAGALHLRPNGGSGGTVFGCNPDGTMMARGLITGTITRSKGLQRNDSSDDYNVQTTWQADIPAHWSLRGYAPNGAYHANCYVARAGIASQINDGTKGSYWLSGLLDTDVPITGTCSADSYRAYIQSKSTDCTFTVGSLGNNLIGFFRFLNTRSVNGSDGGCYMNGSGDWNISGSGYAIDFSASSDLRLKTNIRKIETPIEKVTKLAGYFYNWNGINGNDTSVEQAGVIAQEVAAVFPQAVSVDDKGFLSVSYNKLVPLLIEAFKELNNKVDSLTKEK